MGWNELIWNKTGLFHCVPERCPEPLSVVRFDTSFTFKPGYAQRLPPVLTRGTSYFVQDLLFCKHFGSLNR